MGFFVYPTCIRRPPLRGPRRNIAMTFGMEKLDHERTHTPHNGIGRACIALPGKKQGQV